MVKITHEGRNFEFTLGADPEVFVVPKGSDKPVSAYGLIPGNKKEPKKVAYGAVQVDGMALEFNIDPAKGEAGFLRNLDAVMDQLVKMVPGYVLYDKPVAHFGGDYIKAQPKEASQLGCDPDFNAYTGKRNNTPNVDTPFRTAAGHVHIGWTDGVDPFDPGHFEACRVLAKTLDAYLGLPSLLWDDDVQRRELYGRAGAFRPKPYGMEYRTLSNRWLRGDKPQLRKLVYNNTINAIKQAFKDPEWADKPVMGTTYEQIINNSDVKTAVMVIGSSDIKPPKAFVA